MARTSTGRHTAGEILDVAERLVQTRGFNGFSYADVAAELGVTKAALHYHFRGKAELGEALVARYTSRFAAALQEIDAGGADASARLASYAGIYLDVLRRERMCLCGMLAAELPTLPDPMPALVREFFAANETWLAAVLDDGRRDGSLRFAGSPLRVAQTLVGALEGAMLVARLHGDLAPFRAAVDTLLAGLVTAPDGSRTRRSPRSVPRAEGRRR